MPSRARRNIMLLAVSQALRASQSGMLLTFAALAALELSGRPDLSTLPVSLMFATTLLATVPVAWSLKRFGQRTTYVFTALLGALGAGLASLSILQSSFLLFCAGLGLVGVYNSAGNYYRFTAADQAPPAQKNRALSAVLFAGVAAAFVGPNLARLTSDAGSLPRYSVSALVAGGLALTTSALLTRLHLPMPVSKQSAKAQRTLLAIISQPRFVIAAMCGALGFGVMSLLMTATPLAMQHHRHAFSDTAMVIQWHVFAMFAPAFFTGGLISRFGTGRVMLVGVLLDGACVALNLHGHSVIHYWSALFCLGLGWNFLYFGATALLTETYQPEEREKTQAANDVVVNLVVVSASLLAGVLHHQLGWENTNWAVLPCLLILLAALLWLSRLPAPPTPGVS